VDLLSWLSNHVFQNTLIKGWGIKRDCEGKDSWTQEIWQLRSSNSGPPPCPYDAVALVMLSLTWEPGKPRVYNMPISKRGVFFEWWHVHLSKNHQDVTRTELSWTRRHCQLCIQQSYCLCSWDHVLHGFLTDISRANQIRNQNLR
jgi:hypothetical protein